jgi:hypothetical protein
MRLGLGSKRRVRGWSDAVLREFQDGGSGDEDCLAAGLLEFYVLGKDVVFLSLEECFDAFEKRALIDNLLISFATVDVVSLCKIKRFAARPLRFRPLWRSCGIR